MEISGSIGTTALAVLTGCLIVAGVVLGGPALIALQEAIVDC